MTSLPELHSAAPSAHRLPLLPRLLRDGLERRLAGLDGALRLHETWSGRVTSVGSGAEPLTVSVHDPALYGRLALGGSIGAAEAYAEGLWDCDDLAGLMGALVRSRAVLTSLDGGLSRLTRPLHKLVHLARPNSRRGSKRNIAAHYDLGNDFFRLWLDDTMTYSAGVFAGPETSLAEASVAKLERLCAKLDLRPGMRLLEIGCGWGSLAMHAAAHHGVQVTATTISEEQFALASERVAAAGLSDRVTLVQEDYRDLRGQWDRIASVEMIEAVGAPHLETYLEQCGRLLSPDGLFGLQAITIADGLYEESLARVDFIKRHIFPGCFIPSVTAILEAATATGDLRLLHLEDFGPHYARTLEHWRLRLRERWDEAAAQGYGEEFLRLWEYYLAYCEGGFAERQLGVAQLVLAHPGNRSPSLLPALAPSDRR